MPATPMTNDAPQTDAPKTDAPQTDAPKTDAPKTDGPTLDPPQPAPKTETPKTPATDAPQSATVAPKTEVALAPAPSLVKGGHIVTGDWPMWGGNVHRNMINSTKPVLLDFDVKTKKRVLWTAQLGSQTYGNAVVADGKVYVGTNNGAERRANHKGDRGVVMCFDEKTGAFLWQLTRDKLPQGRVMDWPEQGICSTVTVEGKRVWVVTNRCELLCLDSEGFLDGENDGPYSEEVDKEKEDADIVWALDMIEELGVFPHNLAVSSPLVYEDLVYVVTGNGVDEAHLTVPSPRAPSFVAVNKTTGEVAWEDKSPGRGILHGQWSSPGLGIVNGKAQVYFPGGDGWLYALDAKSGEHVWKFDLNPKDAKYELGGRGTRNEIISTPVFLDNSVVLAVGQDPEHGEGVGHMYRIDATKTGDVTESGKIWHYGGTDKDGEYIHRRTISTVSVHNGLVYAADLSGFLHCVDFQTGARHWQADLLAAVWGSTMVVDGKVIIGDEDGDLEVFAEGKELKELGRFEMGSSIYSTPTIANGVMYLSTRDTLFAIDILPKE